MGSFSAYPLSGTCVSTLETRCYQDYIPQQEVVDYFDRTVEIFKEVPSYEVNKGPYSIGVVNLVAYII